MSEFAKDDNITDSGTDIRETRDEENEMLNELHLKNQKIAELEHKNIMLKNDLEKTKRKLCETQKRYVSKFREPENAGLEHYLYIIVKNPRLRQYNRSRGLYYVPMAKYLRDDMKAEEMRFVALRVQKRNAKKSLRKWLSNGGKIVLCRKVPDPVNWVNLLHRELDNLEPSNRVGQSRNLFHEMMSNSNPLKTVKSSNSIDVNRDVYFDPQYALSQKEMTDYFKPAVALAE